MKKLETAFWQLLNQQRRLENNKMAAVRKWCLPEIDRLDKLIAENKTKSDEIIDKIVKHQTTY